MAKDIQEDTKDADEVSAKRRGQGRFIVADPEICHGKPTFRGTRILVADVLEQVAAGMTQQQILHEWRGHISVEAITEAVQLANN